MTMRIAIADTMKQQATRAAANSKAQAPASQAQAQAQVTAEPAEFTELYHQYFPKVFAYVYGRVQDKEVSLDIVSDVFEKAYIKMRSLRSPESFGSWLFTIARNEVSSHWRKTKPAAKAAQEAAWENELHAPALAAPKRPCCTRSAWPPSRSSFGSCRGASRRSSRSSSTRSSRTAKSRNVLSTSEVNVRVTVFRALRKLRERLQNAGDRT